MAYYSKADSGNNVLWNYGRNPAVNFNFMLRVEALFDLPCKAVRVFHKKNEYERIQEGGLNDYVHLRRKPISEPFTFQVERYVGTDLLDPLALGTDLVLPVILYVSQYGVYNGPFLPIRMYTFTGCTVMEKEYGELNAEKSGLLVETTTIGYREMMCVENIAASWLQSSTWDFATNSGPQRAKHPPNDEARPKSSEWKFKTNKEKNEKGEEVIHILSQGNGIQHARHPANDASKASVRAWPKTASAVIRPVKALEKPVKENGEAEESDPIKWEFDGTKKGKGKQFATHPANDDKHAEEVLWKFDGTKKGTGSQSAKDPLKDRAHSLEAAQEEAEKRLWKFDEEVGTNKEGNGKQSANHPANDDEHAKEVLWKFDGTKKGKGIYAEGARGKALYIRQGRQ